MTLGGIFKSPHVYIFIDSKNKIPEVYDYINSIIGLLTAQEWNCDVINSVLNSWYSLVSSDWRELLLCACGLYKCILYHHGTWLLRYHGLLLWSKSAIDAATTSARIHLKYWSDCWMTRNLLVNKNSAKSCK